MINIYNHTYDLYNIYKESCIEDYSDVYENMDLFSSRYIFFPEYGINSELSMITPDYIASAISYSQGNKNEVLSCENEIFNIVGNHYMNINRYYLTSSLNVLHHITNFHINFVDDYIALDEKTFKKINNFLFKNSFHEIFNHIENYYFLAEILYYMPVVIEDKEILEIIENPVFNDHKYSNKDFSLLMSILGNKP